MVETALRKAQQLMAAERPDRDDHRRDLQARVARLDEEIGRLTTALAQSADLGSVVGAIKAREQERARHQGALAALDRAPRILTIEPRIVRGTLRDRLADWQGLLRRQPAEVRQTHLPLLTGRLRFAPKEDERGWYYEITGEGTVTPLLSGVIDPNGVVAPTGFEPVFQP